MIIIGILNNFLSLRGAEFENEFFNDSAIEGITGEFITNEDNNKQISQENKEDLNFLTKNIHTSIKNKDKSDENHEIEDFQIQTKELNFNRKDKNPEQITKIVAELQSEKDIKETAQKIIKEFILDFAKNFIDEQSKITNLENAGDNKKVVNELFKIVKGKDKKIELVNTEAPLFFNIKYYENFFKVLNEEKDLTKLSNILSKCASEDRFNYLRSKLKTLLKFTKNIGEKTSEKTEQLTVAESIAKEIQKTPDKSEKFENAINFLIKSAKVQKKSQTRAWDFHFKSNPLFLEKKIEDKLRKLDIEFIPWTVSKFLKENFKEEELKTAFSTAKNEGLERLAKISPAELQNFQKTYEDLKANESYQKELESFFDIFKNKVMTSEFTKEEGMAIIRLTEEMSNTYHSPDLFNENFKKIKELFASKFTDAEKSKNLKTHSILSLISQNDLLFLMENSNETEAMNSIQLITKALGLSDFMENSVYHIFSMILLDINSQKSKEFAKKSLENFLNFKVFSDLKNVFADKAVNQLGIKNGLSSLYCHLKERTEWHQKDSDLKISFEKLHHFDIDATKQDLGKNFQALYKYFEEGKIEKAFHNVLDKGPDALYEEVKFAEQSAEDIKIKKIQNFNSIKKYFVMFRVINNSTFPLTTDTEMHKRACKVVRTFLHKRQFFASELAEVGFIYKALKDINEKKQKEKSLNKEGKIENKSEIEKQKDIVEETLINRILSNGIQNYMGSGTEIKIQNINDCIQNAMAPINQKVEEIKIDNKQNSSNIQENNKLLKRPITIKDDKNFLQTTIKEGTVPFLILILHYLDTEDKTRKKTSDPKKITKEEYELEENEESTENSLNTEENEQNKEEFKKENKVESIENNNPTEVEENIKKTV